MERKHETDDVCDLGVTRNLVSGDAAGSRLPRNTAAEYSLCPQSITIVFFEVPGKSDCRKEMVFLQPLMFVTPQTSSI